MIQEIASIHVREGQEALFEAGVAQAKPLFLRARGCHAMELHRSIEQPQRYTLVVTWETVENHMVDFRESPDFQEWRKLVGGFFVEPPQVHHEQQVI
ncbi:Antibiotic biosynthesis monooxygenase [compost metagenome]|jgi:heme-degrading monooxygenase HmoA|uniref:antibiotic biosynthesis monooxygenase family protein n=1 Tax=Achromobacter sp. TaxID=134375 RepID=UPI000FAE1349